ncbi:MAG: hypothetical protein WC990_02185 [Sphaerochaetaceae bacterium]|jgi:predicted ATP-grasp superfamily ATP-dependent carboligase
MFTTYDTIRNYRLAGVREIKSKNRKKTGVVVIEGHVQGLANTRILGKQGVPVIVVDKDNCVAKYSKYCLKFFRCPDYITDDFADFLIELNKKESLQNWVLLPSNDHAVLTISKHKDRLSKLYSVITEDIEVINKIYNKKELLSIAENINVPIPKTVMPVNSNPEEVDLRYPIIIKGNNGLSFYKKYKSKAVIVEDPGELAKIWSSELKGAEPEEYFIQEVIPYDHKTVSFTLFAVKGIIHSYWMGVKLREHPVKFGTATCCQSVYEEDLLKYSKVLIKELEYTGVCEIEWLRDSRDGKSKLIEINARTWLWVGLAEKCGVNYPIMIYDYLINNVIPEEKEYSVSVIWLNLYTDLIFSVKRIVKGIDTLKSILITYKNFYDACWDIKDPIPFFAYGILGLGFLKRR